MSMFKNSSNSFLQESHENSPRAKNEAEWDKNRKTNEHNTRNGNLEEKDTNTFFCSNENIHENNTKRDKDNDDKITSQLNSHLQNTLGELNLNKQSSTVKVKLESDSSQFANKAEVEVLCENPDLVVDKMLQSIVKKFPPTSFVAVERIDASDDGCSSANNLHTNKFVAKTPCNETPYLSKDMHANILVNPTVTSPRIVPNAWKADINSQVLNDISKSDLQYFNNFGVEPMQDVINPIPKINMVDISLENLKYVPNIEKKFVEQIVECPSEEKICVPYLYPVDTNLVIPKLVDKEVSVVLSQSVLPQLEETDEVMNVKLARYTPKYIPVEVYIPKPITIPLKCGGVEEKFIPYKLDAVNKEQKHILQTLMNEMNPHLHQLDLFNEVQKKNFDAVVLQSSEIAKENGFLPPPPIYEALRFCPDKGDLIKIENINLTKSEASFETLDNINNNNHRKKIYNNNENSSNNNYFYNEKQWRSNNEEKKDNARNENYKFKLFNINNNFFLRNTNLFKSCMESRNSDHLTSFNVNKKNASDISRKNSNVSGSVASFGGLSCSTNKQFIYPKYCINSTALHSNNNPAVITKHAFSIGGIPINTPSSSFLEITRQSSSQTTLNNTRRRYNPPLFMSHSAFPLLIHDSQVSSKKVSSGAYKSPSLLSASKNKNNKNNVLTNIECRYIYKDSDNTKSNIENVKRNNYNYQKLNVTNSKVAILSNIVSRRSSLASSLKSVESSVFNKCRPVTLITVGQK